MTPESSSAVAEPEVLPPPRSEAAKTKPKRLPPYAVVVLDDDEHTFQYVIETFIKVFGYTPEKCFQLAKTIDGTGRAVVWVGPKEVAELKRDQIVGAGPDFYAKKTVKFPLGVVLEPMPGG